MNQDQQATEEKEPPVPTEKELSAFTDQQLLSFISWVANGFTKELGQFNTGNTWGNYFKLNDLKSLAPQPPRGAVAQQTPQTTTEKSQSLIGDVLSRFDNAANNNEYQTVTNTWGFKALHLALREAARPSEERTAGVLKGQTEMLGKSLERVSNGDSWRKHLEVDAISQMANDKNLASNENVDKITTKFDRIAQNPEYRAITQLPGFQGIHSTLHQLSDGRGPESSAQRTPPPPETETTR